MYNKILTDISRITRVKYENGTTEDRLYCALVDLLEEYDNLTDEFSEYKQEVEDNTRPLTIAEQIGSAADRRF